MDLIIKTSCVLIVGAAIVGLALFMALGTFSLVHSMILSLMGAA